MCLCCRAMFRNVVHRDQLNTLYRLHSCWPLFLCLFFALGLVYNYSCLFSLCLLIHYRYIKFIYPSVVFVFVMLNS